MSSRRILSKAPWNDSWLPACCVCKLGAVAAAVDADAGAAALAVALAHDGAIGEVAPSALPPKPALSKEPV